MYEIIERLGLETRMIKPYIQGKLSVVYDQAGKARVIAIANLYLQMALKPLHLAIFDKLKSLPCDATFDQKSPFNLLIERLGRKVVYHGFDLSAATDRLPIDLQADILSELGVDGDLWKKVISIP